MDLKELLNYSPNEPIVDTEIDEPEVTEPAHELNLLIILMLLHCIKAIPRSIRHSN